MKKSILTSLILSGMLVATTRAEIADQCFEKMPVGYSVSRSDLIPKDQTDAIGKKLGVPVKKLSNTDLKVQGEAIQVNILETKSFTDARKLHKTLSATKSHPATA